MEFAKKTPAQTVAGRRKADPVGSSASKRLPIQEGFSASASCRSALRRFQHRLWLVLFFFGFFSFPGLAQAYESSGSMQKPSGFLWPDGKKMGLSLTFDDARWTQIDKGIPLLDKYGAKATFYVSPQAVTQRLAGWKAAVGNGHEIGNHSVLHPCSGNFPWARTKALENYSLSDMEKELQQAGRLIEENLGIQPISFAYPCGQKYVGRGATTASYIPVVASLFESGRGWLDEAANDPQFCDLSQIMAMELDGKSFEEVQKLIDSAKEKGQWLVLAGHEMNDGGVQTSRLSTLEAICRYATDPKNGIWLERIHTIASYIREKRNEKSYTALPLYKNPLYPIAQRIDDLLSRMSLQEKIGQMNIPCVYKKRIGWGLESQDLSLHRNLTLEERQIQMEGCRKFTRGNHNQIIGPGGGFFTLADRIVYEGTRRQAEFFNELQTIALKETRLGIPLLQVEEGTHGLMCAGGTIFPEGLALGSTWNMDLIGRVFQTAAKEGRATGMHVLCTLVIEPNRDPRLGRNQEGFSEDTYLCSRIAEKIVTAMQGYDVSGKDKVIAALCHYPGQSEPISGFERGAMEISERKLREVFLPPWVAGIKKHGALAVMATYPAIDGVAVHSSEKILKTILRGELGFEGIVLSEGQGISTLIHEHMVASQKDAGRMSVKAGVDVGISMEDAYLGELVQSVEEGLVSMEDIDTAVRHILTVKYKLGLFESPFVDPDYAEKIVHSEEHRKLALETAREGIVLLKNEKDLLPLNKNLRSIAVIGPVADAGMDQIGDYIPHHIPQELVTVLDGIRKKVPAEVKVNYVKGCNVLGTDLNEIEKAKEAAKGADVAIVVVGERGDVTDGEGKDVANLDLTGMQQQLLESVYSTGTPTVAVLINGRPLSIRWAAEKSPAIVEAWMCGEEGGHAVADVLFGDYNPNGKLPITVPRHSGQLPAYYNYRPNKESWAKRGYVDMPGTPLYSFGHGLSYTKYEYTNLQITPASIRPGAKVQISLEVKNIGKREGKETIQLYIQDELGSVTTPVKQLRGFQKIVLAPNEKQSVSFTLGPEDLSLLDQNLQWIVEPGDFKIMVGSSSADIRLEGKLQVHP